MSAVEFIRELEPVKTDQRVCLVRRGEEYFVSSIEMAPDHGGAETLAFAADADGEVTSYADVAGGTAPSSGATLDPETDKGDTDAP